MMTSLITSRNPKGRTHLQSYFQNNKTLAASHFHELIDSTLNKVDDRFYGIWQAGPYPTGAVVYLEGFLWEANHSLCSREKPSLDSEKGYDLTLMSLEKADDLPPEGQSLVIVAKIDNFYHVRIFDIAGNIVIDKGKDEFLPGEELVQELDTKLSCQSIEDQTKRELLHKITSALDYIPWKWSSVVKCEIDQLQEKLVALQEEVIQLKQWMILLNLGLVALLLYWLLSALYHLVVGLL